MKSDEAFYQSIKKVYQKSPVQKQKYTTEKVKKYKIKDVFDNPPKKISNRIIDGNKSNKK